jgi:hypothetical protein
MDEYFLGIKLRDWAWIAGGIITLIGVIKGLWEFSNANRIKRAEFLEKLILEFSDKKMFLAKRILDDFWLLLEYDAGKYKPEDIDEELIKEGSIEKKEKNELKSLVKDLLRSHNERSVTRNGEHRARQSFDDLLDFFTKLDYYLTLKLISKDELNYFSYYIKKCAFKADGAVMNYAKVYGYPSLFRLFYVLGIEPKIKSLYEDNLKFDSSKQESRYYNLKNDIPFF